MGDTFCRCLNKVCTCLTCGKGKYVVRFIHTLLCLGIPATIVFNKHSDLHRWLMKNEGMFFYGFVYLGILLASLIFYYAACLTDPGYVDQLTLVVIANDEENEEELFNKANNKDISPVSNTHEPAASTSSVETHNLSDSEEIELEVDDTTKLVQKAQTTDSKEQTGPDTHMKMCRVCNVMQPLRSKHCEDCKRCVLKYDHHCPWLATCVGEKNHKFFWLFLLFINMVILFSLGLAVRAFPSKTSEEKELKPTDMLDMVFVIVDCIILVVGGFSTVSLFCFHSYLMFTNQTTWESVSRSRISYLKKFRDDVNPFHLGYFSNVYTFCCKCRPHHWNRIYKKASTHGQFEEL